MKRRSFLAAAPALGLIGLPTSGRAGQTQILQLFHRHRAIIDASGTHVCAAAGKGEEEELERLFYRHSDRIEAELMALPCTCAADFAAKVIIDSSCGNLFSDWESGELWQEARSLVGWH